MLLQEVINTAVQLTVVLVICTLVWLVFGRKRNGLFAYLGLIPPMARSMTVAFAIFIAWQAVKVFFYFHPEIREAAAADNTVAGQIRAQGASIETFALILIIALFKTALAEEILFRGLIAKRLINGLGFWAGNTIQAAFFGAIHLLIFVVPGGPDFTPLLAAMFFGLPGMAGWLMGFANEKMGNGSIAPGWLIHALGNATSYPILAFLV